MRPLLLELEGFTSFADRTVVDFAELQLFAITGPTGAGKSSLLDAMLLALFGKVPRVGSSYKQLVTDGQDQILVRLDFTVGGEQFRVARRIRHKGSGEVRLERIVDGVAEPIADRATDVDAALHGILGVDYATFTRAVILPQGQFDAFLRGDAKDRRELLARLLGLEVYRRMAELVGQRHRRDTDKLELLDRRLERELAGATPTALADLQREVAAAAAAHDRLCADVEAAAGATQRALELRRARAAARAAEAEQTATARDLAAARSGIAGEERADAAFAGDRLGLERALQALPAASDRGQQLATAAVLAGQLARLLADQPGLEREHHRAAARVAQVQEQIGTKEAALPRLREQLAALQQDVEATRAAHEQAQQEHAAAHLRRHLHAGEVCPVCEQEVAVVPAVPPDATAVAREAWQQATRAAATTERQLRDLERDLQRLIEGSPTLDEAAVSARARVDAALGERARIVDELRGLGLDLPEPLAPAALQREISAEQAELQQLERRRAGLLEQLAALEVGQRQRAERLAAARAQRDLLQQQLERSDARCLAAADELHAIDTAFAAQLTAAGIERPAAPSRPDAPDEVLPLEQRHRKLTQELSEHALRRGQLAQRVEQMQADIGRAAALRTEREALGEQLALAAELRDELKADRFQTFVQEEAMQLLTEDGSARLLKLSQGRYSLRYEDGDFAVVDHWNADRRRSIKTLSGGETFLASLALSLGLAERLVQLAAGERRGSPLECLFVDEGFGALDPEALETAVQALETLHGGERMVGVVTHLPELADRMPARLTVINQSGRARVEQS